MKRKLYFVAILVGVLLMASCSDDIIQESIPSIEETSPEVIEKNNNEAVYLQQTDRFGMLVRMVWYDKTTKQYTLNLSEEEARELGFTTKEYQDIQQYVKKLNMLGIEHL